MRSERPPPPVTVSGGPLGAAVQQPPEPEHEPRQRRGGPLLLVGLALLGVLGVAELRERAAAGEAAQAEAERRQRAVDLVVTVEPTGSTSHDAATDSVTFVALLRLRNAGPQPVTVTAVEVPGVQLLAPAVLAAGRERGLTLRGERSCRDDLVGLLELDVLPLEVDTPTGQQAFDLGLGRPLLFGDALLRACGVSRPGLS